MRERSKWKNIAIEVIDLLFILLFVYAAVSKIIDFENFQAQIGQSVILGAYAGILSYLVIIVELITALFLVVPACRLVGLYLSFTLMCLFTVYIFIILNFSSNIPCSCGGILEKMSWKQHLIFNSVFLFLAVFGIIFKIRNTLFTCKILLITFFSICFILVILNISSQYLIHKENPFIRKFVHMSANKKETVVLPNKQTYFAGASHGFIYIGNNNAPLHIFAYDTLLKISKHYKIKLDRDDLPFRSVQVKVIGSYFFVLDGSIPVIYRGKISDWKAEIYMLRDGYYFSKTALVDSLTIAFRTQNKKTGENELGVIFLGDDVKSFVNRGLLEKQIDGFFDTDGMLNYSSEEKKFIYLYYYRNEFIVTDEKLKLKYRGNTIDTISKARLKPVYLKEIGRRKLASPDNITNKISAVRGNQLFVNSRLIGRFESKKMWDISSIIDVYKISDRSYISSFYVYDSANLKMHDMQVDGNNLYVIIGKELQRYSFDRNLKIRP